MEDKKKELAGLIKEQVEGVIGKDISDLQEKEAAREEANAKILEENKELKDKFDAMQEKVFTLNQNTGVHKYVFKGYDTTRVNRNFKVDCSKEVGDEAAKQILKALTTTGTYAVPVEYSNALLGLAELSSVALAKARIYNLGVQVAYFPTKATRATIDAQAFSTANAAAATDLGQLTFTIDKRIGSYETINNDTLLDQNFDVVGEFVEPMIAEAIGQELDNEMFNGGEFTSPIYSGGTAGVTVSGAVNMAAAITYANLVTLKNTVELERGLSPEWFMPRGCLADVEGLVSASTGSPIFNPVPISQGAAGSLLGYPINIVSALDNTPDDGAIRLSFGDPKHFIMAMNGGITFQANPYVLMKEAQTQFIGYARADGNVDAATAFANLLRTDA